MINYTVFLIVFHLQVKHLCRLFRPIDSIVARDEGHVRQHKMNNYGINLDIVAEREVRLLTEEAFRNREERLRREYRGNVDAGHVQYGPYAPTLQTHNADPVVFERELPNYGFQRHLSRAPSTHEGYIRNPPVAFYDPATVLYGREMLHYGVERDPVPLVSSDPIVDQPLDSNETVYQRRSLAQREQLLPRNDLLADLHYRPVDPQYDVYRQRIEMDMRQQNPQHDVYQQRMDIRQHIMDGAYPNEMKKPH